MRSARAYRADGYGWMAHRKWKESKQQPSMCSKHTLMTDEKFYSPLDLPPDFPVPCCCLVSFHFLWAIHPIRPVLFMGWYL